MRENAERNLKSFSIQKIPVDGTYEYKNCILLLFKLFFSAFKTSGDRIC